MTVPSGVFTILGSPITSSGTLQVGLVNQLANTVWCGPTSGAESVPTFRLLVSDDIPNLSASKITSGTLPVARGGTGASTLTGVLFGNGTSAFTGIASTTANQMLRVNSAGTGYEWFTPDYLSNVMTSLGDMIYGNAVGLPVRRSGNTTTTKMFLSQTGDGTSSAAPQWSVVTASDVGGVPTSRQLTINGTSYDLSADRSWSVGTITSLTGEATASGTGAVAVTLTNSAVIGKVLTGLNTSGGGTIVSTDSILEAFGKVQNQISALVGGVMYEGTWNASTNSPTITSSVGNKGDYYVVSVAGSTTIDGISDWKVGDWIIFNGSVWDKVDNTDAVSSVNGFTGAVSLSTSNIGEGTNLYFTNTRAQNAITLTTSGTSGASTYSGGTLNIPNYSLSGLGGVPTTRTLTINGTTFDLSADRTFSVGTVTSVALSVPTGLSVSGSPITTSGTLAISLSAGYSIPTTSSQTNWDAAYNDKINSAAVTGTTTKTLTLTQQDGGTITASWTDDNTDAVTSVFGRTGAVVATSGDYTTAQVTESGNLYYTDARARAAISLTTTGSSGSATYSSSTGVLNVPTYTASGLGAVPTSRTITINDVVFDLSANRSWSVGDFGTW
jgi:hypothetical protein